ncbi:MAG: hypothetical protein KAT86_01660, partial [Candidatus Latescibacteria bacterium]|nr:hypothetical protein [Candidatus Latescibacterota bacterium]
TIPPAPEPFSPYSFIPTKILSCVIRCLGTSISTGLWERGAISRLCREIPSLRKVKTHALGVVRQGVTGKVIGLWMGMSKACLP